MNTGYTRARLTEVKDSAPGFGFGDNQEAHFATGDLDAVETGVSYHRVKPGMRQGFAHRHDVAEEVYVVIGGGGRMKLDNEIIDLAPLDAIRVAPATIRQFEGGPDGLELIAFGPHRKGDGEIFPGWWTD
jgi:mannose-6-phosphate isomerase-like protein (cupin superfamily)